LIAGLNPTLPICTDIGDAQHVGGARCAQWHAGRDDDPVARLTKTFGGDDAAGVVDHVVEVGGPGTLAQSIGAVRVGGHISLIGVLTGASGEVPTAALMAKQARLQGLIVGSRRMQQDFVRAIEANDIRPVIDRRFPLDRLADAFAYEQSAGHFGKIGVEW